MHTNLRPLAAIVLIATLFFILARQPRLAAAADCTPQSASAGRFKLESRDGVSWLIDPEGRRFFSVGVNGLDDSYRVTGEGQTANPSARRNARTRQIIRRMNAWGFNTAGAYSAANLPLTFIPDLGFGSRANFHWADPFDPSIPQRINALARELVAPYKTNPCLIGYFSDNEVGWWNGHLFTHYLKQPATNFTKQKLVALIRRDYADDWHRFAGDFVLPPAITSFQSLLDSRGVQIRMRPGGNGIRILEHWTAVIAEHYYRLIHQALRSADPDALIFGDRLPSYYDADAVRAMAPFVDAVATNYNVDSPDGWVAHYYFDAVHKLSRNKPILVSEWYFAAQQNRTGNLNNGPLMTVPTQAERALGAASAARHFAANPYIVGIHWFQYYDEPRGGRADGEDYDFGLLDYGGRPYHQLVAALESANRNLSHIHQSAEGPAATPPAAIAIPAASIDARNPTLVQWPKDDALVHGMHAPEPDAPFGDFFLAWSSQGLHLATIAENSYLPDILAWNGAFPLSEAFRIDLGVATRAGPSRFAVFIFPDASADLVHTPMDVKVCRMNQAQCGEARSVSASWFGSRSRLIAQATFPWAVLGISAPPADHRLRVQLAATGFYRSHWMSLSGAPPQAAMDDASSWKQAVLKP